MGYSLLADFVIVLHVAFVVFVLFGGLLALKWPRALWFHLPAVLWGTLVEFTGWFCPLTPLEDWLRRQAGEAGYGGDFLQHYLLVLLYPDGLTREIQIVLATIVIVLNLAIYFWLWRRSHACPSTSDR